MTNFRHEEQLIDYENLELDENLAIGLNSAMGSLLTGQNSFGASNLMNLELDQR